MIDDTSGNVEIVESESYSIFWRFEGFEMEGRLDSVSESFSSSSIIAESLQVVNMFDFILFILRANALITQS